MTSLTRRRKGEKVSILSYWHASCLTENLKCNNYPVSYSMYKEDYEFNIKSEYWILSDSIAYLFCKNALGACTWLLDVV